MRIKIIIGVAVALGLVLLFADYRDSENQSQASVPGEIIHMEELPFSEFTGSSFTVKAV